MKTATFSTIVLVSLGFLAACGAPARSDSGSVENLPEHIIALERSALDRWIRFDPQGYLDLFAPEVTYFDPYQERRVDGLEAMNTLLAPIANMKGSIRDPRYEMIAPRVQHHGEVAILTFNVINYGRTADGPEAELARWNSTEVYGRVEGQWKLVHSHWSYIRPERRKAGDS